MEILSVLFLSVILSVGRNVTTKKTALFTGQKASFFLFQTVLFTTASQLLLIFYIKTPTSIGVTTLIYGLIYGCFILLSQWMFTFALKSGNTSVCSVIYSLGFIIPTVSGSLFWGEQTSLFDLIGIVLAVIILLSAKKDKEHTARNGKFVPYIIVAMVSSGGLGVMQKIQQSSRFAEEKAAFLLIAFLLASLSSMTGYLTLRQRPDFKKRMLIYPTLTGLCFGGANLCNTVLAGRMRSAAFFPTQNVLTILLTMLFGCLIFKEKLTAKNAVVLLLGVAVVIVFCL